MSASGAMHRSPESDLFVALAEERWLLLNFWENFYPESNIVAWIVFYSRMTLRLSTTSS